MTRSLGGCPNGQALVNTALQDSCYVLALLVFGGLVNNAASAAQGFVQAGRWDWHFLSIKRSSKRCSPILVPLSTSAAGLQRLSRSGVFRSMREKINENGQQAMHTRQSHTDAQF